MRAVRTFTLCLITMCVVPQFAYAKLNVFACSPEWGALAAEIGGDEVDVYVPTTPPDNPFKVRVSSSLVAVLNAADLLVCTGVGSEQRWLPKTLEKVKNNNLASGNPGWFLIKDVVKLARIKDGHTQHAHWNPFVQGDPRRVRSIAGQLAGRMIQLDKDNAKLYKENAKNFIKNVGRLADELEQQAVKLRGLTVVTVPGYSDYLFDWLGINVVTINNMDLDKVDLISYSVIGHSTDILALAERLSLPLVALPLTISGAGEVATYEQFYRTSVGKLLDAVGH